MTPTSMKVIILGGVLTFVFLWLTAGALKNSMTAGASARTTVESARSPFDGKRAYEGLLKVVKFGPRPAGSPALDQLRGYIESELRTLGMQVRRHEFEASTPQGIKKMVNLVGIVQGSVPGVIVLGNHYDTKYFPDFEFVGANDGGSTTAWMLEMARALGPKRTGRTVWLCFFDGEEAFKEWSAADSLYGSREFVLDLRGKNELASIKAMVNVDMIGGLLSRHQARPRGSRMDAERRLGNGERTGLRHLLLAVRGGRRGRPCAVSPCGRAGHGPDRLLLWEVQIGPSADLAYGS